MTRIDKKLLPYPFDKPQEKDWVNTINNTLRSDKSVQPKILYSELKTVLKPYYSSIEASEFQPLTLVQASKNNWLYNETLTNTSKVNISGKKGIQSITLDTDQSINDIDLSEIKHIRFKDINPTNHLLLHDQNPIISHVISDVSLSDFFQKNEKIIDQKSTQSKSAKIALEVHPNFDINTLKGIPKITTQFAIIIELIQMLFIKDLLHKNDVPKVIYQCKIHPDYFLGISEIRAIKKVWFLLNSSYQDFDLPQLLVHTISEETIQSDKEDYSLLQHITQSHAALCAGCDILSITSKNISATQRANISNVLRNESYIGYVSDPYAGAYAIEALTDQIVQQVIEGLKDIEKHGGIKKMVGL